MNRYFKGFGICISISSLLSFVDPMWWHFTFPVVFALGCIVYGLGVLIETISKTKN